MNRVSRVGIALTVACMAACGGGGAPESAAPAASTAPSAAPAPEAAAAAKGRDLSALKACEIVIPAEVAAIVGGKLLNEPPPGFANCVYVLEANGTTESYRIVFSDPAPYVALLATQSDAEKGEPLAGLWDEAYVQKQAMGDGFSVIVLKRGDLALESTGPRKEPAIEIAKLAASRVN